MHPKHWLDKKPQTIKDWLGLAFLCLAFFTLAGQAGRLLAALGALAGLTAPFAWAIVLAYVLDTLVRPIHQTVFHGRPGLRWAAILAAYLLAGLAVFLLVWLVVPQVLSSVTAFFRGLPDYVSAVQASLRAVQDRYGLDLEPLVAALEDYEAVDDRPFGRDHGLGPAAGRHAGQPGRLRGADLCGRGGQHVHAGATKTTCCASCACWRGRFCRAARPGKLLELCRFANQTFAGFFFGKIVASAIIGLLLCAVMSVLGMSYAPMLSVLAAFANLIPIFGIYLGALPGVVVLLFVDPVQAAVFLALIIGLQQFDIRWLAPKVLGHTSGLSAFWVLFAIAGGAWLWGPAGMVLGVPAFATVYGVLRRAVYWLLDRRGVTEADLDPAAAPAQEAPAPEAEKEVSHV